MQDDTLATLRRMLGDYQARARSEERAVHTMAETPAHVVDGTDAESRSGAQAGAADAGRGKGRDGR